MPLTFSHPAIVLPLNYLPKRWVSLTGLIAGSVAPDFEYFFRMKVLSIYSHTWLGLFWFDLPVALAICFVYHDVVRKNFITNLPGTLKVRFIGYAFFNWNQYFKKNILIVILSILIGSSSHLFWDSFTHITGYFVTSYNMAILVSIFSFQIPLYKIIQHISTLLGAIVIVATIYKMPKGYLYKGYKIWPYWLTVIAIIFLIIGLRIAFGLNTHQYWNILVTSISGGITALILTSLIFRRSIT